MMKKYFTLFVFFTFIMSYGQHYSNKNTEYYVKELTRVVVDSNYMDIKTGELLDRPIAEYWVYDNLTSHVFVKDPDYSDNKNYSVFQKIYKKGKVSDFMIMAESNNPSIRLYGFWALVKNRKYKKAKIILRKENQYSDKVYWNSFGCEVEPIEMTVLMNDLIKRMKKYGR